jgi:small GTP-binding protein
MSVEEVVASTYKIVVVGEYQTGKTSIIRRFAENKFSLSTQATVGVDFKSRVVEIDGLRIMLQIWDTAGQERFRTITRLHFRGALGIILVYDVTNMESFTQLDYWVKRIQEQRRDETMVVLGNKSDLSEKRQVQESTAQALTRELGIRQWETSALDNVNINEAIVQLAKDIKDVHGPHVYLSNARQQTLLRHREADTDDEFQCIHLSDDQLRGKTSSNCRCSGNSILAWKQKS